MRAGIASIVPVHGLPSLDRRAGALSQPQMLTRTGGPIAGIDMGAETPRPAADSSTRNPEESIGTGSGRVEQDQEGPSTGKAGAESLTEAAC